jgi:Flp pilus assembly pilin Flp
MNWQSVVQTLRSRIPRDDGQDLMEYGLLMMLIAVAALVAVKGFGDTVNTVLWEAIAAK